MTYRTFTTSAILLTTLLALYEAPSVLCRLLAFSNIVHRYQRADDSSCGGQEEMTGTWFPFPPHNGERSIITIEEEADIRALKFRICNVIKMWMDEYFEDFRGDPSLLQILITFIRGKLIREGRDTLANILKTSIYNKVRIWPNGQVSHSCINRLSSTFAEQFHTKQLASKIKRLSSSDMIDAVSLSPPKPKVYPAFTQSRRARYLMLPTDPVAWQGSALFTSVINNGHLRRRDRPTADSH